MFPSNPGTQAQSCTAPRASVDGRPRHRTRRACVRTIQTLCRRSACTLPARRTRAALPPAQEQPRRHSVARLLSFLVRCKSRDRCISARQVVLPAVSIALRIPNVVRHLLACQTNSTCDSLALLLDFKLCSHVRSPISLQFSNWWTAATQLMGLRVCATPWRPWWPWHPCRHPSAGAGRRSSAYRVPLRHQSCP